MAPDLGKLKFNTTLDSLGFSIGGNPFGGDVLGHASSTFVNSIMAGDGVEGAFTSVAQMTQQWALNAAKDAIGGLLGGTLKIGAEKAKALLSENKIENANSAAENAAKIGIEGIEGIVAQATIDAACVNNDVQAMLETLEENKELLDGKYKELKKQVKQIQQYVEKFEKEKEERDELQAKYDKATGDDKEKYKKKLDAANAGLGVLAQGINVLQATVSDLQAEINEAIEQAKAAQAGAEKSGKQLADINNNTQGQIDSRVAETEDAVASNSTAAANEAANYYSNSYAWLNQAKNMQNGGVLKSLTGIGALWGGTQIGLATQFFTLGNDGKNFATNAMQSLVGIGTDYTAGLANLNSGLGDLNNGITSTYSSLVNVPSFAQAQIDEANTVIEEYQEKEEYSA